MWKNEAISQLVHLWWTRASFYSGIIVFSSMCQRIWNQIQRYQVFIQPICADSKAEKRNASWQKKLRLGFRATVKFSSHRLINYTDTMQNNVI
jgi:hypothetical protein